MARVNKVERISLSGGILGALTTNPRRALEKALDRNNAEGWVCRQVLPHTTSNIAILLLQILVFCCTFGLWTFGAGYLLLLEKDQ